MEEDLHLKQYSTKQAGVVDFYTQSAALRVELLNTDWLRLPAHRVFP